MRIIAGTARGRRILSVPKTMMVKPISGRMRQSLFDILRTKVTASHFLDLFAGTGAVGLEALSRGAERVCFVEKDPRCMKVIERNLEHLGLSDRAVAFRGNVLGPLDWIPFRAGVERFDLVFLGPPYRDEENRPLAYSGIVLANIAAAGLLAADGWVVVQRHKKEAVPVPKGLASFREARYGDTVMTFFRRG